MSGLEKQDDFQDTLQDGNSRYAAFAMRLRTLIVTSSRYVAYSSDIGEAFRPLTNPYVVRGAYGISWAYILGDCGYAGYLAHKERQGVIKDVAGDALTPMQKVELRKRELAGTNDNDTVKWNPLEASTTTHVGLVVARRAVFQGLASMALPAFTIHSIVRYSAPLFAKSANARVRATGPTVAGLLAVPALPFMFDHPVEHAVDTTFDFVEQQLAQAKAKSKEVLDKKTKFGKTADGRGADTASRLKELATGPTSSGVLASTALVGVGVDLVHLPRIYALIARHSRRLAVAPSSGGSTGRPCGFVAAQQLARRVMHDSEFARWQSSCGAATDEQHATEAQVLKLATTWAAKEAAYKAISGISHPRPVVWHDAMLDYIEGTRRPVLRYTEQLQAEWQAQKKCLPPHLHLSITHDGDYVTAFVVAEQRTAESDAV